MNIPLAAIASLAVFAWGSAASAQSPIEGAWSTRDDHGVVRIGPCGDKECGVLVTSDHIKAKPDITDEHNQTPALRSRLAKGMSILTGFAGGPVEWKGGKAYNPTDGGTYSGTISLAGPNTLKLRGCIFYPLCQTQVWTRVKGESGAP